MSETAATNERVVSCKRVDEASKAATRVRVEHVWFGVGNMIGEVVLGCSVVWGWIECCMGRGAVTEHEPSRGVLCCGGCSQATVRTEGDAGFELLDILLSKVSDQRPVRCGFGNAAACHCGGGFVVFCVCVCGGGG